MSFLFSHESRQELTVGIFNICIGMFNFRCGVKSKKVKATSFDKAALMLFSEYDKVPSVKVTVTFTSEKVKLMEDIIIDYSEMEQIFITEDLFILIWNERVTVLQKKDLLTHDVEEFIYFITDKSQDLFDVVNIF